MSNTLFEIRGKKKKEWMTRGSDPQHLKASRKVYSELGSEGREPKEEKKESYKYEGKEGEKGRRLGAPRRRCWVEPEAIEEDRKKLTQ